MLACLAVSPTCTYPFEAGYHRCVGESQRYPPTQPVAEKGGRRVHDGHPSIHSITAAQMATRRARTCLLLTGAWSACRCAMASSSLATLLDNCNTWLSTALAVERSSSLGIIGRGPDRDTGCIGRFGDPVSVNGLILTISTGPFRNDQLHYRQIRPVGR